MVEYVVFLPLLGAIITGLTCRLISHRNAQLITTFLLFISALLASCVFVEVVINKNVLDVTLLRWFSVGDFTFDWALLVDPLTAVMLIVVTYVSAFVHLYSVGYMSHDPNVPRFMSYLSLFTFCMLMLVTSNNLVQLFFGWEGVGLCSYLLIGFWYKKQSACNAAIKAFLVNRVGDIGFALGIFTIYMIFGTVEFNSIFAQVNKYVDTRIWFLGFDLHAISVICTLLFIGAMGKSAQLGLHTWLPDAMEGPTPVSALIHAATMVTAGVFLVSRTSPLFEFSEFARNLVTIVGATTCLFAATIAVTQNDIKRIVAYSTCSQLGYMFFACGVSAYSAAIFHLMTHGFFKALLFLGAGSVIHAMSDEQDIRKMGGIWKKIPYTYGLMWIGSLALAGIYPFAGFYSKDIILEAAYASHSTYGKFAFSFGIIAAFLTAFYSWRLIILTFHGQSRAKKSVLDNVHESPKSMMIPLYLLAFGSIIAGGLFVHVFDIVGADGSFWLNSIYVIASNNSLEHAHHVPLWVKLSPLIAGIAGIALAYYIYMFNIDLADKLAKKLNILYQISHNKYYFDELYNFIFVKPAFVIASIFSTSDKKVIDGIGPDGVSNVSSRLSSVLIRLQTGFVYHYALVMLAGLVILLSVYVYIFII